MENGIVIRGKFYQADWISDLIETITIDVIDEVTEKVVTQLKQQPIQKITEVNYTADEIAELVNKSRSTITRHIRIKLLKGHKVGKAWLITEEDYQNYRFNRY